LGARTSHRTATPREDNDNDNDLVVLDDDDAPKPNKRGPRKTSKTTNSADKEAKAREREAAKARRERERQLEKERKQREKEEKAREKAREKQLLSDLTEANKRKVDKKDSTPEMIVDLAMNFEGTDVGTQAMAFMDSLNVEHSFFDSVIPNVVKWRRKVKAHYNDSLGYWEPCPLHIRDEEHVLVLLQAQEFVDMVLTTDPSATDLTTHVSQLRSAYPNCKLIYLIQGLAPWMRKNKSSRNRAYVAEVRREMEQSEDPSSTQAPSRRRKPANKPETTPPVDDDTIEDALLELQVTHSCLIHHTNVAPESAEWIKNFTEHVSTVPYRRERMDGNDAAFCMDGGQVKSGENKTDTYVKMLQEVNRVTASMAYGVAERYPSVLDLVTGMRRHGPGMLENVKVRYTIQMLDNQLTSVEIYQQKRDTGGCPYWTCSQQTLVQSFHGNEPYFYGYLNWPILVQATRRQVRMVAFQVLTHCRLTIGACTSIVYPIPSLCSINL
jgi:crossover junction endonuclease EME1